MPAPSNDNFSGEESGTESPFLARQRGSIWLAWLAIVATIGIGMIPRSIIGHKQEGGPLLVVLEIQAKYLVGVAKLPFVPEIEFKEQIQEAFGKGSWQQRLVGIVLLNELAGPSSADNSLQDFKAEVEAERLEITPEGRDLVRLFHQTIEARLEKMAAESKLSDEDRSTYHRLFPKELGWVGKLAILPRETSDDAARSQLLNQARRTACVSIAVVVIGFMGVVCGLTLQVVWWAFLTTGRLRSGFGNIRGHGALYAETFAIWLALFLGLSWMISLTPILRFGLIVILIPQIAALAALGWPVWRGVRWSDVREDIGLKWGPHGWTAPFVGVGAYLSALPLLFVAMLVTLAMMKMAAMYAGDGESIPAPAHPIVEPVLHGDWHVRWQLLLIAVFAAVPEEIMFRGVLYRHLRDVGRRWNYVASVGFAMLLTSFIFAVIHPQGVFGIPVLMALAMVFTVVREWRGSLIPCMITHAMVNAITFGVLILLAD